MREQIRGELIALLQSLIDCSPSEAEEERVIARIHALSPDPEIMDYVFHAKPSEDDSVEAAVDRALRFKPIRL